MFCLRLRSSAVHVVCSQLAMARLKAGFWQIQVRLERLLQETGAVRPRGMQFCWSHNVLADVRHLTGRRVRHTAHGGQLARFVGSPVMFVALTATVDKAISNKAEIEGIVLLKADYGRCK